MPRLSKQNKQRLENRYLNLCNRLKDAQKDTQDYWLIVGELQGIELTVKTMNGVIYQAQNGTIKCGF
ncbi:hypothetical protein [Butyricicoccus intestinisimiae]|uniref:Uncharacterized protein n=1 Tax=Butyricicoccus intestinisimiae TaxID=2841509 RepID=A0ABS6EU89_9FIRM|nr:hypothetical protein [Butyricicoccus intestinisimiae]MBU5491253.1 hypothetical protein [Butyricicoccus intestinisimiae]